MKRNISIRKTTKTLLGLILCAVAFNNATAQNTIREFSDVKSNYSVIRDIDGQNRMIMNEGQGRPFFLKVTDANGNVPFLELPNDVHVRDFTIYDRTVYFCGYRTLSNSMDTFAVVGWFELAGFPVTNVSYSMHYGMKCFEKIKTYVIAGKSDELHMVMIAHRLNGNYTLTDAHKNTLGQMVYDNTTTSCSIEQHEIDDIIVTTDYVIASSHIESGTSITGFLWHFEKPVYLGDNIFSGTSRNCSLGRITRSKVILESLSSNDYAVLFRSARLAHWKSYILRLSGISLTKTYYIANATAEYGIVVQAVYNPDSQVLEILTKYRQGTFYGPFQYHFHHFDMTATADTVNIPGRKPPLDTICSVAYLHGRSRYEASGYNMSGGVLKLYDYSYRLGSSCLTGSDIEAYKSTFECNWNIIDCMNEKNAYGIMPLASTHTEYSLSVICRNIKDNE